MLAEGNQASSKGNTGTGHGLGVQHFPSVPKTRSHTETLQLRGLSPRVTCRGLVVPGESNVVPPGISSLLSLKWKK